MKYVRFRNPAGAVRRGEYDEKRDEVRFGSNRYSMGEITVLPPCEPSKIVCTGLNYADHAAEIGKEPPDRPRLFFKPPNAIAAHGTTVTLPTVEERVEYEAELAVIVGQQCRNVDPEEALAVVDGYTCMNDLSNRDEQERERNYVRSKGFDGAAPLGPIVATPEEVPEDATVRTRVNGERRQDGSISEFIFTVPELIAEITTYITLEPGDVVATGTPGGVGPVADGDRIEIEIEGIGTLEHEIAAP